MNDHAHVAPVAGLFRERESNLRRRELGRGQIDHPPKLVAEIDAYKDRHQIATQAEAIRQLLQKAVDADKPKKRSNLSPDEAAALVVLEKLRKRIGAADASQAMEQLWRMLINWENEAEPSAPEPAPAPPPTEPPAKGGILSKLTRKK